jgi:hypothetical protein
VVTTSQLFKINSLNRFKNQKAKWLCLSWQQRKLLIVSMLLLPVMAVALRVFGLSTMCQWLNQSEKTSHPELSNHHKSALEIARMVDIAATRGFYKANCLKKTLVTKWWLNREHLAGDLVFGVRLEKDSTTKLNAHAWLECNEINLDCTGFSTHDHAMFRNPFTIRTGST